MVEFHPDAHTVVVRIDGEVAFRYFDSSGGIEVVVNPDGPGDPPHFDRAADR